MTKRSNPVDVAVGRNIRLNRIARGMSQTELGDRIDVTFQQVQKYEKGTNRVGASRINMISKALDIPLARLFDGIEGSRSNTTAEASPAALIGEPQAFRLATAFAAISDSGLQRDIVQLVERIAKQSVSDTR